MESNSSSEDDDGLCNGMKMSTGIAMQITAAAITAYDHAFFRVVIGFFIWNPAQLILSDCLSWTYLFFGMFLPFMVADIPLAVIRLQYSRMKTAYFGPIYYNVVRMVRTYAPNDPLRPFDLFDF